jgi:hypothetical protein
VCKISYSLELRRVAKKIIFRKGICWNSHTKAVFWHKNSIWKILGLKLQMVETCSSASSTRRNFYFWKTLKSQFLVVFQSFVFAPILAIFGSFGQFWVNYPAFIVVESMPKLGLKSSKPHNFSTVSPNVTCNGSLESYHPYL